MASKAQTNSETQETREEAADGPLMDMMTAAVKKMIQKSKERGYVTYDELNAVLPPEQMSSEQIEDTMALLSEMGINVIESEEQDEPEETAEPADEEARGSGNLNDEEIGRTDDPVRMYLREMGSVELLSREGEIAIAKRIEAGREMMIGGICESPLTMKAIIAWRDALMERRMLLRDIIDLDATYGGGPGAEGPTEADFAEESEAEAENEAEIDIAEGEEEGEENAMSLSAMEQALMPTVLATFDSIADTYKKLAKVQEKRLTALQSGEEIPTQLERRYQKLTQEIVELMEKVRLNNLRIEQLVHQLYELNRRLMGLEGQLLRTAEACGIRREQFLERYYGDELDPNWLQRNVKLGKGWKDFAAKRGKDAGDLRERIAAVAAESGLPISEFRRIFATVQKGEREACRSKKEMV